MTQNDAAATRLLELRHELAVLTAQLNLDETEGVVLMVRKLLDGVRKYGHLDLAADRRDFDGAESLGELMDLGWYRVFAAMKRRTQGAPELADERLR